MFITPVRRNRPPLSPFMKKLFLMYPKNKIDLTSRKPENVNAEFVKKTNAASKIQRMFRYMKKIEKAKTLSNKNQTLNNPLWKEFYAFQMWRASKLHKQKKPSPNRPNVQNKNNNRRNKNISNFRGLRRVEMGGNNSSSKYRHYFAKSNNNKTFYKYFPLQGKLLVYSKNSPVRTHMNVPIGAAIPLMRIRR